MIAYVDSSVLLRVALGEANRLPEWKQIERAVSSQLSRVECLRTIDRMRLRLSLSDDEVARRREAIFQLLRDIDLILLAPAVLERASQPFPTTLGSLDAIHLASAILWQLSEGQQLQFLTHDHELGRAARASGLTVLGCA